MDRRCPVYGFRGGVKRPFGVVTMKIPEEFKHKMRSLLGEDEYKEFMESYAGPRHYGLRVNTLKTDVESFLKLSPFKLKPVPWTSDGFYYAEGESPGKHPYYHAGLYYIQEPSAMFPGEILDAGPGERILDLCAAPGGKTVQIAARMNGRGILVANEINPDRAKALVRNIELCGVKNAVVTVEKPERLVVNFEGYFDRILVDAPCSGEGMFRKDDNAVKSWGKYKCMDCASVQKDILDSADRMLKPGGCLVYSTCTFSPEEDEAVVSGFLNKHGYYEVLEIPKNEGIMPGRPEWCDGNRELAKTSRLWPHKVNGEGHFAAKLKKLPSAGTHFQEYRMKAHGKRKEAEEANKDIMNAIDTFSKEYLNVDIGGYFINKGPHLYCMPEPLPDLSGIRVAKFGWYLGEYLKGRFEPSHSMVIALKRNELKNVMDFEAGSREISSYLKGETLSIEGKKGLTAVCVDGYTLGWAKQTGDILKNLYPKGWRRLS
jgi:NOL1/NOP2/sun family putative RNA methylase